MHSIFKNYKLLALFVACFCFASLASATVIVSRPGPNPSIPQDLVDAFPYQLGGEPEPEDGGLSEFAVAVSWTSTEAFENVLINVFNLQNFDPEYDMAVTFFLRSALDGPDLASSSVTVEEGAISDGQPFTVFDSLTLNANTPYFLIASAPKFNGAWLGLLGGEVNDPSASFGTEYIRDSSLAFVPDYDPLGVGYEVNGTLVTGGGGGADIPEPGSWLLQGTGLLALAGFVRRRSLP